MSRIEQAMEKAARLKQLREVRGYDQQRVIAPGGMPPLSPRYGRLSPSNPYLVNLHDPQSPSAEEYRKLKSALVDMTRSSDSFHNTLLITSSLPKEGKSLTALNLAISLAQELDHTVLLVDADLRQPALHCYFEIEQGAGLADVLVEGTSIGDTIIPTGIGKLSIMRAGTAIDNPVELFTSSKMKLLVDELKRRYPDRYLIFDSSPLLPFAESRSLARLVDGVILVVMERVATQTGVREALSSLNGSRLLGVVYNAALPDGRYSSYYRRYEDAGERENGKK
jgi:receptor protein-tyrosine kinase/non-specific protein-tyrosine kinase